LWIKGAKNKTSSYLKRQNNDLPGDSFTLYTVYVYVYIKVSELFPLVEYSKACTVYIHNISLPNFKNTVIKSMQSRQGKLEKNASVVHTAYILSYSACVRLQEFV
jgi:hypothetical protein